MQDKRNTDNSAFNQHGGDLSGIRKRYPQVRNWQDISTGINPNAYPLPQLPEHIWHNLPDHDVIASLCGSASSYYGVAKECITPAPGTQSLIQHIPTLRLLQKGASKVQIASPTYNEHATCWKRVGHTVYLVEIPSDSADVVVITSPNNPDGKVWTIIELEAYAKTLKKRDGWLIIDEAYMDVTPEQSFCEQLQYHNNVIILRSFGKFFGMAGMRLGFALAHPALTHAITDILGPWAISHMACVVGARALRDDLWITRNRENLQQLAQARDALLERLGLNVIGTHPLYCLIEADDVQAVFNALAQHGFYARMFDDKPNWLRIGAVSKPYLPQLEAALKSWHRHAA